MMNAYSLPVSLNIGGTDFFIRTDFRAILDILQAFNDPELAPEDKMMVELMILYKDYQDIPDDLIQEALQKATEFIDAGQSGDGKKSPKLVDWEQDASIIIPAVNKVAGKEIRACEYMHWWTFLAYYMEIGEGLFSTVVNIRKKRAEHKKLEKYEREFYQNNKELIEFKSNSTAKRSVEEEQALADLWG